MRSKLKTKLKAKLRNWLFKDYKWITRAEVTREICALQWKNKDRLYIVRLLEDLKQNIS